MNDAQTVVRVERVKLRELIALTKSVGFSRKARGFLIRDTIADAEIIIRGNRLEIEPQRLERCITLSDKLKTELSLLTPAAKHVHSVYLPPFLPYSETGARQPTEWADVWREQLKSNLETLSASLQFVLEKLQQHRHKSLAPIEQYIFAGAHRWVQAGGNPGRRTPSWKRRIAFGERKEAGPFGQFLRLVFEAVGGDPETVSETKIKGGLKQYNQYRD